MSKTSSILVFAAFIGLLLEIAVYVHHNMTVFFIGAVLSVGCPIAGMIRRGYLDSLKRKRSS